MNKAQIKQVRLIGKEIRERFFFILLGLLMLSLVASMIYFNFDLVTEQEPFQFLEGIGFFIMIIINIALTVLGLVFIVGSFTDEGWNIEDDAKEKGAKK